MKPRIEEEIAELKNELLTMGAKVERNIGDAVRAMIDRSTELASAVLGRDVEVDLAEIQIDRHCLDILALHQPVARDLRFVTTTMKIVKDLERVGDTALDIAKRSIAALQNGLIRDLLDIPRMSLLAQRMLNKALDSFVQQDVVLARQVIDMDDQVDELHDALFKSLKAVILSDSLRVEPCLHLLHVAHYLERIGDHSCNISEMVVFLVDGEDIRHAEKLKALLSKDVELPFEG